MQVLPVYRYMYSSTSTYMTNSYGFPADLPWKLFLWTGTSEGDRACLLRSSIGVLYLQADPLAEPQTQYGLEIRWWLNY